MYTSKVVATAKSFNSENAKLDKNGKSPVFLNVISGKAPNRNILAGTIAENEGIEIGKTYLFQVSEKETSEEFGRQFVWNKISEMSGLEVLQAETFMNQPEIFKVEETENGNLENEISGLITESAKIS